MLKNYVVEATTFHGLHIKDVGEEDFPRAFFPPKQKFCYIIHFIVSGSGIYKTLNAYNQTESNVKSGYAFAIFRGDTVSYQPDPKDPFYYFWVGFDGEESEKIMEYIGFSREHPTMRFNNTEEILNAFRTMFALRQSKDKYGLFVDFFKLVQILRKNSVSQVKNFLTQNESATLTNAEKFIQAHIGENLTVDDIANAVHLSRSHFSRLFKARFNVTPHEYIVRLRLRNAEILLQTSDYSITKIVELLNFTDIYSFSKLFKKYYHCSPTVFRKQYSMGAQAKAEKK